MQIILILLSIWDCSYFTASLENSAISDALSSYLVWKVPRAGFPLLELKFSICYEILETLFNEISFSFLSILDITSKNPVCLQTAISRVIVNEYSPTNDGRYQEVKKPTSQKSELILDSGACWAEEINIW